MKQAGAWIRSSDAETCWALPASALALHGSRTHDGVRARVHAATARPSALNMLKHRGSSLNEAVAAFTDAYTNVNDAAISRRRRNQRHNPKPVCQRGQRAKFHVCPGGGGGAPADGEIGTLTALTAAGLGLH